MTKTTPSFFENPEILKTAFKTLHKSRRWGPRLLNQVCKSFRIQPEVMMQMYCIFLVIHLSLQSRYRHKKCKVSIPLDADTVRIARETLLEASFSKYSDNQITEATLAKMVIQMQLRQKKLYVDLGSEISDPFLNAVRSLSQVRKRSSYIQLQISKKLQFFQKSSHANTSNSISQTHQVLLPITRHLAQYRAYNAFWRYALFAYTPKNLAKAISASSSSFHISHDYFKTGIETIVNAFESSAAVKRFGKEFTLFQSLLFGKGKHIWKNIELDCPVEDDGIKYVVDDREEIGKDTTNDFVELCGELKAFVHLNESMNSSDQFYMRARQHAKRDMNFKKVVHLFEALCTMTNAKDCRHVLKVILMKGGFHWLKTESLIKISETTNLSEDEMLRIQSFAQRYISTSFSAADSL